MCWEIKKQDNDTRDAQTIECGKSTEHLRKQHPASLVMNNFFTEFEIKKQRYPSYMDSEEYHLLNNKSAQDDVLQVYHFNSSSFMYREGLLTLLLSSQDLIFRWTAYCLLHWFNASCILFILCVCLSLVSLVSVLSLGAIRYTLFFFIHFTVFAIHYTLWFSMLSLSQCLLYMLYTIRYGSLCCHFLSVFSIRYMLWFTNWLVSCCLGPFSLGSSWRSSPSRVGSFNFVPLRLLPAGHLWLSWPFHIQVARVSFQFPLELHRCAMGLLP